MGWANVMRTRGGNRLRLHCASLVLPTLVGSMALASCSPIEGGIALPPTCDWGYEGDVVLESLEAYDRLKETERVEGSLSLCHSWDIEFAEFPRLSAVAESLNVVGNLELRRFKAALLAEVPRFINVSDNARLEEFVIPSLQESSLLEINNNPALTRLDLTGITHATTALNVRCNDALADLSGLANVVDLDVLRILGNENLAAIDLPVLEEIFVLEVGYPSNHCGLNGNGVSEISFPVLRMADYLGIHGEDALAVFDMPSLERVYGDFDFVGNGLEDALSFPSLSTVAGGLFVGRSDVSAIDLPLLQELGGGLLIGARSTDLLWCRDFCPNKRLTQLLAPVLRGIGTDLMIKSPMLTELDLQSLTAVSGTLILSGNEALTTLDGLAALNFVGGDVIITDNTSLPTCEAEGLRDRLVANGYTGTFAIYGNDDTGTCL